MTTDDWAGLIVAPLFVGAMLYIVHRKLWHMSEEDAARSPSFFPYGLPVWKGVIRAATTGALMGATGLAFVFAGLVMRLVDGPQQRLPEWSRWLFLMLFAALALSFVTIIFLNRPKRLVPPRLRSQRGAIAEWRARTGERENQALLVSVDFCSCPDASP